ncbi:MAG: GNAT family protein [Ktedonobacteraceae bacterium]
MSIDVAFTQFPTLATNRLHLRQLRLTDAEALFAMRSDPEGMEFFGQEPQQSIEETHTLIQRLQTFYDQREALFWCITLKGEDTVIGSCTFFSFGPHFHYAETGYELHRAYWRQGITTEAMSAVLTYGFTELGLHRIEADVAPENIRSKNLLLKLGFTFEGNLRQRYYFRGQFEDEYYFGLLKDEWLKPVK